MSEIPRVSTIPPIRQAASPTANLAAFLLSTGPPDLPSFPSTPNTISKSVKSKSVPRRWLRKVASRIGMRKENASDGLFPESPHLSIKEFKDGTSVKMINSPNMEPPPPLCRIIDNPRMSASLSWASPANPLGVFAPLSDSPAPPSPNIALFSPRPPSPVPTLRYKRRSATVSAATGSLPRFSFHPEDDDVAASDPHLVRPPLPTSSGTSHASSSATFSFSFSNEGSRLRSPTTTTISSVSPLTDDRSYNTSTTHHPRNNGPRAFMVPLPAQSLPQSTSDCQPLEMTGIYPLERKSKQRARNSTLLTNLFDPLTLGSPNKPKGTKERIPPPLAIPYRRERRLSFLEDVKVEQDLGWGASVVDMLNAKQVDFLPVPPLRDSTHQGTDDETETNGEPNPQPPKLSHGTNGSEGDNCGTPVE